MLISRRRFLELSAAGLLGSQRAFVLGYRTSPTLRIGVVNATRDDDRRLGLTLGVEEATHAAEMFGGAVEISSIATAPFDLTNLSGVIGDEDCQRCIDVAAAAARAGVPFFNVACPADSLRGADCQSTMFHIAPSDAMYRDAASAVHNSAQATAWDPSLQRFGADTLNRRFQTRFGRPMTVNAWTAWLATKILWESYLRTRSVEAAKLIEYLRRPETKFDGHKGQPLSFRSWDRQLRQPLYVPGPTGMIDVPAGNSDEPSSVLLDRLGVGASASACHR